VIKNGHTTAMGTPFDKLRFDNSMLRELPIDPIAENRSRQVRGAFVSRVAPTPVNAPRLVAYAADVASNLGLDEADMTQSETAEILSGVRLAEGMDPFSTCYGGHQFGHWAGQLGDGRAISLGELINADGQRRELQLKGAGPTPYSRSADGRAVLRSSIREFLCSEAMHHLGIPTTRALSLVTTGDTVMRDMFYDGRPEPEIGAIVCRVAPSFLRFGHYEIAAAQRDLKLLKTLVDYTIKHHGSELGLRPKDGPIELFRSVCLRTAETIVEWMRVGFVHGVMNTDNMSILGHTIDYGPYGWLDDYDPSWTPNTTDSQHRRYRFGAQPQIGHWNLAQLANALLPLVGRADPLQLALDEYRSVFQGQYQDMMRRKLGLADYKASADDDLVQAVCASMSLTETDMTLFFRCLAHLSPGHADDSDEAILAVVTPAFYTPDTITDSIRTQFVDVLRTYLHRLGQQAEFAEQQRIDLMNANNPVFVFRNYIAQQAIESATDGDFTEISRLLETIKTPYDDPLVPADHKGKRPDWARDRPGCSTLSCSS